MNSKILNNKNIDVVHIRYLTSHYIDWLNFKTSSSTDLSTVNIQIMAPNDFILMISLVEKSNDI